MILRTRNERVLYRALEAVCNAVNKENANLMLDVAIAQAGDEIPPTAKFDVMVGPVQVAEVNNKPTPEGL